ncbi:MAG: S41 family peptidase [Bacteroidales bacterium]|nr:S41 family peptidase [Bacteroidales bacterium]
MMNNRFVFNILRSSILMLLIISFGIYTVAQTPRQDPNAGIKKYNAAMQLINYAYVDTVDEAKLVEKSIVEALKELDPHSVYISKKDVQRANEPLEGNFDGIGVQFEILKDTISVVHAIPGGPSERLGIMSGDKIVKIDTQTVVGKHITNQFVLDHLRGKRGTKVNVSIFRKGKKDLIDFTITRDKIPINSIDAAYMIKPGIGYINLNKFAQTSMQEFVESTNLLKSKGMKSMILDLRNNSGGYMGTAIDLSDEFLRAGKLIVYTKGVRSQQEDFYSTARGLFETGKLVIMINENSASASEIVSGAVQDWDRGIIVGRRSFGKGLVQRPYQLPDSSQIRLTTARYYNPSGKCIQKPYSEGTDKYYTDLSNRMKHGEMVHPDSIKFPDSLKFYTSKKRVVYGGGGIMPDIFIAWDSTPISDYYLDLRRKNVVNTFVSDYVDKSRKTLKAGYPEFSTYDKNFQMDELFMADFFAYAEKEGVKLDEKGYADAEKLIKAQIKGLIAQKLWDMTELYTIINQSDQEVQKAIAVVEDEALFEKLGIDH